MSGTEPTIAQLRRNATFSHQSETVLRDLILNGTLQPGERINEVALSKDLGISRGPLREGLQRLAGEGLLTVISHRGTFVRQFDADEIVELYELRIALETYAVRLACRRASEDDLTDLEALLAETATRIAETPSRAYPSEPDFHARLIELSANSALARAWLEAKHKITLARIRSARQPFRARAALHEHIDITSALGARDEDRAARLVADHLEHSMHSALAALHLTDPAEASTEDG